MESLVQSEYPKANHQTPDSFNGMYAGNYACLGVDGAEEAGERWHW